MILNLVARPQVLVCLCAPTRTCLYGCTPEKSTQNVSGSGIWRLYYARISSSSTRSALGKWPPAFKLILVSSVLFLRRLYRLEFFHADLVQQGMSEKVAIAVSYISSFITGFVVAYVRSWRLALALSSMLICIGITGVVIVRVIRKYRQQVSIVFLMKV